MILSLISHLEQKKASTLPPWWGQQEGEHRVKPCVAWEDKAALPQPLLCRAPTCGHGCDFLPCRSPLQGQGDPQPLHTAMGWVCMARGNQLGSCSGTSWLWDQQDIIIYECLSGQHKLLCIKPKRSEGLG